MDDLAAIIRDCDRPAGVVPHLMEQSTSEFRCGLVSRSLGCQRVGQIDALIVPHEVVLRAQVEEVTRYLSLRISSTLNCNCRQTLDISGLSDPDDGAFKNFSLSGLPSAPTSHVSRPCRCLKEAGDRERSPASQRGKKEVGSEDKEASRKVPISFGNQSIP